MEQRPGQFYMIEISKGLDPLLKRAFSLFRKGPGQLEILYRIRGKGTTALRSMGAGTVLDVLGPLGTFYPLPEPGQVPVIVAGGIGIASVFSLAEEMKGRAIVLYGGRSSSELLVHEEIAALSREIVICTDDGSQGRKGTVTAGLDVFFEDRREIVKSSVIYACGPAAMLREVAKIAGTRRIRAYVSMEEHMACGVGACLGCVVKTRYGYQRVCKDGPVFDAREIDWRTDES